MGKSNGGQTDGSAPLSQRVKKTYAEGACPNCYKPLVQKPQEQFLYRSTFSHTVAGEPDGIKPHEVSVALWCMKRECIPCGYRDEWASDGTLWYPINPTDSASLFSPENAERITSVRQYWEFVRSRTPEDVIQQLVSDFLNRSK